MSDEQSENKELEQQHDQELRTQKYVKVRQYLGNNKWAVRWLPENYQLRVDEEIAQ